MPEDVAEPPDAAEDVALDDAAVEDVRDETPPDVAATDARVDGDADDGGDTYDPTLQGGCACRAATPPALSCSALWLALCAVALARRRR